MNILSVSNALKEIKISQLDDEFQTELVHVLTPAFAESGANMSTELSGDDLKRILNNDLTPATKTAMMNLNMFMDHGVVIRFYSNVEKIQQAMIQELNHDDDIKASFLSNLAVFEIVAVLITLGIYHLTEPFRGKIPESKILAGLDVIINNLSNLN